MKGKSNCDLDFQPLGVLGFGRDRLSILGFRALNLHASFASTANFSVTFITTFYSPAMGLVAFPLSVASLFPVQISFGVLVS